MSVRKSGSGTVSLNSSARPDEIRPAQCWSLGCYAITCPGRSNDRACWRMASGWNRGWIRQPLQKLLREHRQGEQCWVSGGAAFATTDEHR
jgi:hypothetical protein